MTLEEIKASGLLELFALGQLSPREQELVREHLATYPSLKDDLKAIEKALEGYAKSAAIAAPSVVKQRILNEIGSTSAPISEPVSSKRSLWPVVAVLATIMAFALFYLYQQKDKEYQDSKERLRVIIDSCSTENQQHIAQIENLQQLTRGDNEILHMVGTENFPQTDLYFHHNPVTKRNFIQIRNLPDIAANQSFQLWSLKPDSAPIPLDVFQRTGEQLIEVRHVDASASYAITIEPLGGQDTPTLEHLIGIVNVGS